MAQLRPPFTEADHENRTVPDVASSKVNAVKIADETMKSMETAAQALTIFVMMLYHTDGMLVRGVVRGRSESQSD